ncbi:hypothetical protein BC834DRAFT_890754 [Gloeopeniophorella convolvens]|nr:hypothetical protein BC834DRAFT_890754 [Gloeopeniophorella convolvens]
MASLLERMNVSPDAGVGPVRSKSQRAGSSPYTRPPKGDINSQWKHDMFQQGGEGGKSLSDRLDTPSKDAPPKMNFGGAARALREATGLTVDKELSILGASTRGNVVEVTGLVKGTSAEDVEAIFKRCGPITQSSVKQSGNGEVTVRLTFKQEKDAREAVRTFDKQVADGRTLGVRIVGGVNASLSGRLGLGAVNGSVDALMETDSGSKMRSDDIISRDPEAAARAHILIAPPGADPKDYVPAASGRGGRGRGRGRPRRGAGGGRREKGDGKMELD